MHLEKLISHANCSECLADLLPWFLFPWPDSAVLFMSDTDIFDLNYKIMAENKKNCIFSKRCKCLKTNKQKN